MIPWSSSLTAVAIVSAIPMLAMLLLSSQVARIPPLLPRLVPVAAGAMLGAALFHLAPEALLANPQTWQVAGTMALGVSMFWMFDRLLHRGAAPLIALGEPGGVAVNGAADAPGRFRRLRVLTMSGDALHNVIDGMLIAAAYMDNPSLGILTGAAIALHELPRELGTFALLVRGGMSTRRAVLFNVATALGAVAGAVATLLIGTQVAAFGAALIPFAAGNFLYLGGAIAWAELRDGSRQDSLRWRLGMILIGLLLTSVAMRH